MVFYVLTERNFVKRQVSRYRAFFKRAKHWSPQEYQTDKAFKKKKKNSRLFNLTYDRPFLLDNLHRACHLFEIRRMLPRDQTMHLHSNSEALQLPLRRQAKWNFERQQLSLNYLEQFNHPKWVVEVVSDCAKSIFGLLSVRINLISLAQKNW